ncbi:hypothetical protein NDU88_007533 [Pleurodeles waltl]|uniref:Uncharacterized protein n=1 Tax=Pleurodeles waltl TaxID=8319 RepID=A0AAV7VQS4_PLEWA|nr:hypothetical protein NDU88_007533 [Pleurodeles waltl]
MFASTPAIVTRVVLMSLKSSRIPRWTLPHCNVSRDRPQPESKCLSCDQKAREEDVFGGSWKGSYQVVLITTTHVKCARVPNWTHASHTRRVPCPLNNEEELLRVPTKSRPTPELEMGEGESETESEQIASSTNAPVRNEGENLQESDSEPTEVAGESSQRRALPEADGLERQTEKMTDPDGIGVEVDQSQCGLTPPEPVAGTSKQNPVEQREITSPTLKRALEKGPLKGDKWLKSQAERKNAITMTMIEEDVDTTRKEDLSNGALNGD